MRYNSREEVDRIGRAGAYWYPLESFDVARMLSSFWLCIEKDDLAFSHHAKVDGMWEAWVTCAISNIIKPGDTVVDVGANVGYYTGMFAMHGCKVISVDPNPLMTSFLAEMVEMNGFDNVTIVEAALTDSDDEQVTLFVPENHSGAASIVLDMSCAGTDIVVPTSTLDSLVERASFVKIDAEGAERDIWAGSEKFRANNPECVFMIEWMPSRSDVTEFLVEIEKTCRISVVGHDGFEKQISREELLNTDELIMVVLRRNE